MSHPRSIAPSTIVSMPIESTPTIIQAGMDPNLYPIRSITVHPSHIEMNIDNSGPRYVTVQMTQTHCMTAVHSTLQDRAQMDADSTTIANLQHIQQELSRDYSHELTNLNRSLIRNVNEIDDLNERVLSLEAECAEKQAIINFLRFEIDQARQFSLAKGTLVEQQSREIAGLKAQLAAAKVNNRPASDLTANSLFSATSSSPSPVSSTSEDSNNNPDDNEINMDARNKRKRS